MVEEVPESKYESLQHFISNSPLDSKGLMLELAKNVSGKLQPYDKISELDYVMLFRSSLEVFPEKRYPVGMMQNCDEVARLSDTYK